MLAASLSLDAFFAAFAYGSDRIRIPFSSAAVIDLVCGATLFLSMLLGALLRPWLPDGLCRALCFLILFAIGLAKLLNDLIQTFLRSHGALDRSIRLARFDLRLVLSICADPKAADADHSKALSLSEAAALSIALSLDGLAVGFGAALGQISALTVLPLSLAVNALALLSGARLGARLARQLPFRTARLSGAMLLLLAVVKLL